MMRLAPKTRQRSGATLVEVMIAGTVLLLILSAAVTAFSNYSRYVRRVGARTELQQQSILIMSALTRDLSEANRYRIYSPAGSNCIIFPQPRDSGGEVAPVDPLSGRLTWGRITCYRITASHQLVRQLEGLAIPWSDEPPDVSALPIPRDQSYFEALPIGSQDHLFPGDLRALTAEPGDNTRLGLTMRATVNGRVYELDNASTVAPRN